MAPPLLPPGRGPGIQMKRRLESSRAEEGRGWGPALGRWELRPERRAVGSIYNRQNPNLARFRAAQLDPRDPPPHARKPRP